MKINANAVIRIWVAIGLLAYVALPWYSAGSLSWFEAVPQIFGGIETANGISQALLYGRKWLLVGAMGMMLAVIAIGQARARTHALLVIAGGVIGAIGLLVTGPLARTGGLTHSLFAQRFGEAMASQPELGAGGWVAFGALVMLAATGFQRLRAATPAA